MVLIYYMLVHGCATGPEIKEPAFTSSTRMLNLMERTQLKRKKIAIGLKNQQRPQGTSLCI